MRFDEWYEVVQTKTLRRRPQNEHRRRTAVC